VTVEEVSIALLDEFGGREWRKADRDLLAGRITLRETMEREFGLLRAPRAEMEAFVRKVRLRRGFRELLAAARRHGVPFVIVSEGLDFYIRAFLEDMGIEADIRCNRALFGPAGIVMEHPYADGECDRCGTCKKAQLLDFRARGFTTVYIGDGISDRCPAREADVLFARDGLLEYCGKQGIRCHSFRDFKDVLAVLGKRFWKATSSSASSPRRPRPRSRARTRGAGRRKARGCTD
jgi:2,3-diketo-5-methylthio-1-phosphopentane phosphatase